MKHARSTFCRPPLPGAAFVAPFHLLLMLLVTGLSGCGDSDSVSTRLESISDADSVQRLTHSLNGVALERVRVRYLEADLDLSHPDTGFAHIADVASVRTGFAILDRQERRVHVYDSTGGIVRRFGREGKGPGEYSHPLAIAGIDSLLVIWDNASTRRLTVLDTIGSVLTTLAGHDVPGDWRGHAFRKPTLDNDDFQMGPEDVTRRLAWWNDSTVAMFLQTTKDDIPAAPATGAAVIGFTTTGGIDTLLVLPPHTTEVDPATPARFLPESVMPILSGRSLWTRGRRWYAYAHGDSSVITIVHDQPYGKRTLIRWTAAATPVSGNDQRAYAMQSLADNLRKNSSGEREWQAMLPGVRKAFLNRYISLNSRNFASVQAEIQGIWAAGNCLFASGTRSADYIDGTSHALIVWDVARDTIADVVRVDAPGARIRHIDSRAVYMSLRDDLGVWHLLRYPHAVPGCVLSNG